MKRVVVTGLGLVTPLGCGVSHVWNSLLNGKCGITRVVGDEYAKIPSRVVARVPKVSAGDGIDSSWKFDQSKYVSASDLRTMSPASIYALAAADEALRDAFGDEIEAGAARNTGVAIGMGMSDLEYIADSVLTMKEKGPTRISPYFVPRILTNMAAGLVSMRYGFQGPNHSVSTACATGAHSIGDAANFIRLGAADIMVCGGTESCITPLSLAGFSRLRALSTKHNDHPEKSSRPFDIDRDGFVMGEGAGMLVLEELEHAIGRNAKIYAEVLGYGASGDASHLTAPSDDGRGAVMAMSKALRQANVTSSDVTYVNAHATSTPLGDLIELSAINQLLAPSRSQPLRVSSMKGALGHGQGAAGAIETCLSIVAIYESVIPPNLNLDHPDPKISALRVQLCGRSPEPWQIPAGSRRILLKNSFGFGGTNASLCIGSYP